MKSRSSQKPLGYEPYPDLAMSQMCNLVHALNGTKIRISYAKGADKPWIKRRLSKSQRELRGLVQAWMESGPDLIKLFRKEPELKVLVRHGRTYFYPVHDGRGHLDWLPAIPKTLDCPYDKQALQDFMVLITNPLWELLGGPCVRCTDYYLKKAKRQKIYCSRKCSSTTTATFAVKQKREREHEEMIRKVQKAIEEWEEVKRRIPWKRWVSNKTGYSEKRITQAVNKGKLIPPCRP